MEEEKRIILSRRMQAVCGMVTPGKSIVDVGCDHGYVDIFLVQQRISPRVLAMDVREGPLNGAREHVAACRLQDYIEIRKSDGLEAYRAGEAQALICAGMGGRLMRRILAQGREKTERMDELILQPQSEISAFRAFLRAEGYLLPREMCLEEGGKYYFLMKAVKSQKAAEEKERLAEMFGSLCGCLQREMYPQKKAEDLAGMVTELSDAFGMGLLWEKNETLYDYLKARLKKYQRITERLVCGEDGRTGGRRAELESEIERCRQALVFYET